MRHPERVSHLILYGGYALGWNKRARSADQKEEDAALVTLMRLGWGKETLAFRQPLHLPVHARRDQEKQADWFNENSGSASRSRGRRPPGCTKEASGEFDVTALLPRVSVLMLVLHARHESRVPFEAGRRMAAGIPGAQFVALQGRNHLFLETEPAFGQFLKHTRAFLAT